MNLFLFVLDNKNFSEFGRQKIYIRYVDQFWKLGWSKMGITDDTNFWIRAKMNSFSRFIKLEIDLNFKQKFSLQNRNLLPILTAKKLNCSTNFYAYNYYWLW